MSALELISDSEEPTPTSEVPKAHGDKVSGEFKVIRALQGELGTYYAQMREFGSMDITDVFMALAAMSARASEVRSYLGRQASRRIDSFRTKELDPFIDECDRQFRIWSRLQSVRQLEADISGKAI